MFKEQPKGKGGWTTLNGGGRWQVVGDEVREVGKSCSLVSSVRTLDFTLDDGKHRVF